jgi:hypothetical protein
MQDATLLLVGALAVVTTATLRASSGRAPLRRRLTMLALFVVPAMLVAALAISAALHS